LNEQELARDKDAGALFKITNVGAKGLSGGVSYKCQN